jgi:segregation and condensation protein B
MAGIDEIIKIEKDERGKARIVGDKKPVAKTAKPAHRIAAKTKKPVKETAKEQSKPRENALSVIEAALFMSPKPLMLDDLARVAGISSLGYLKSMLQRLQEEYAGRGVEIANSPHGWHMQVRQEFLPSVAHLTPYSDLSEGCKRALALIIYKDPLKQCDLIRAQGNKAYSYLKTLERRGLIKREPSGRTMLLKVTQEFERYFGEEKGKIKEGLERAAKDIKNKRQ